MRLWSQEVIQVQDKDPANDGPEVDMIRFFGTWPHGRYPDSLRTGELNLAGRPIDGWRANQKPSFLRGAYEYFSLSDT